MAKKRKIIKKFSAVGILLPLLVVIVLAGMTAGFARYNQIINTSGLVNLHPQGKIRITDVHFVDGSNAESSPTFDDENVYLHLTFTATTSSLQNEEAFYARYLITVQNDTFYNEVFSFEDFEPVIIDDRGNPVDMVSSFQINGISNGDKIASGESATFEIRLDVYPEAADKYHIDNDPTFTFTDTTEGSLLANITSGTTGNLRGDNTLAPFTIHVINSYEYARSFNFALVNNPHFKIVSATGGNLPTYTLGANEAADYTVYVAIDGQVEFMTTYERANIYLESNGLADINCGRITLYVDQSAIATDHDAPIISNVSAHILDAEGEASVTWDAEDEITIDHFTVLVYQEDNNGFNLIRTIVLEDDAQVVTVDGLDDDTYRFKVYGIDAAGNTATQAEINSATTSPGHCSVSSDIELDWSYTVTYSLSGLSASGADTVRRGETYTTRLSVTGNGSLPSTITVTMNDSSLTVNQDYTYNRNNGTITIPNVSGNIRITARANTFCLIEGTKVLLYDGTTKNIEDITYDDLLAVWSYDTGGLTAEYPIWIEKVKRIDEFMVISFEDGTELKVAGSHGIFNVESNLFVNVADAKQFKVGSHVYKIVDGELQPVKVTSIAMKQEEVNYYDVVSARYYNIVANGILTTDARVELSNLYGFTPELTWPSIRDQAAATPGVFYHYEELGGMIPRYMYEGLRMTEAGYLRQAGMQPADFYEFVVRFLTDPNMVLEPTSQDGVNLWTVSVEEQTTKVTESSYFTLPTVDGVKSWHNSVDGRDYAPGDQVQIWCGTHFSANR